MKNSIIFTEDDKFKPKTTLKVKYPKFRGSFKNILIDDADDVLRAIFATVNIDALTMSYMNGR